MEVVRLEEKALDLPRLDEVIRANIPAGKEVHEGRLVRFPQLQELCAYRELKDTKRIERSIGTLGGGNHFIEADKDGEGNLYIVIHSGSRNLGKQIAEHYQKLAIDLAKGKEELFAERERIIREYKEQGRRTEIQAALKQIEKEYREKVPDIPEDLAYLQGKYFDMYIHDMRICQEFATLNRKTMMAILLVKWDCTPRNSSRRSIIISDMDTMILRKGAVSSKKGEKLIVPMNMRDGSLICIGKGNPDWNYSAPHGAGRVMSRSAARARLAMSEYEKSMEGSIRRASTKTPSTRLPRSISLWRRSSQTSGIPWKCPQSSNPSTILRRATKKRRERKRQPSGRLFFTQRNPTAYFTANIGGRRRFYFRRNDFCAKIPSVWI